MQGEASLDSLQTIYAEVPARGPWSRNATLPHPVEDRG